MRSSGSSGVGGRFAFRSIHDSLLRTGAGASLACAAAAAGAVTAGVHGGDNLCTLSVSGRMATGTRGQGGSWQRSVRVSGSGRAGLSRAETRATPSARRLPSITHAVALWPRTYSGEHGDGAELTSRVVAMWLAPSSRRTPFYTFSAPGPVAIAGVMERPRCLVTSYLDTGAYTCLAACVL